MKKICVVLFLSLLLGACSSKQEQGDNGSSVDQDQSAQTAQDESEQKKQEPSQQVSSNGFYEIDYPEEIYTDEGQAKIQEQVDAIKAGDHTLDQPALVLNPYGTTQNAVWCYFEESDQLASLTYTVESSGVASFSQEPVVDGEADGGYEFLITGLQPGASNHITLVGEDESGKEVGRFELELTLPELEAEGHQAQMEVLEEHGEVSDGYYIVDGTSGDEARYSYAFDNDGVLRLALAMEDDRLENIHRLSNDEYLLGISKHKLARMNRLGKLTRVYEFPDFAKHHDFVVTDDEKGALVLTTDVGADVLEDTIAYVDLHTGETHKLIDMKDLTPDYYQRTRAAFEAKAKEEQLKKEQGEDYDNHYVRDDGEIADLDWIHFNSIDLVHGDELILSGRETSSIIKLSNIFDQAQVDYILGEEDVWQGTPEEKHLLKQKEPFVYQAGQHTVRYYDHPDNTKESYHISLFDNNYWWYLSQPDYTGAIPEDSFPDFELVDGAFSRCRIYKVDEQEGTVEEVLSFKVPYSSIVSSVQQYQDHLLVNSGKSHQIGEYTADGQLIKSFRYHLGDWSYRVTKEDLSGFFFK